MISAVCTQVLLVSSKITPPPKPVSGSTDPAPLVSTLKLCAEQNVASFHFPGHNRGRAAPPRLTQLIGTSPFTYDIPEVDELDNLYNPTGVILDAQAQASSLFGASRTWFLVGGTTAGILAAILATCSDSAPLVLQRNSHISTMSGMIISGANPRYVSPEYSQDWDIAGGITPSDVESAVVDLLERQGKKPGAVFVTSPTYHGVCSDISGIAKVCHSHGIALIVDEAHGSHFKFHSDFPLTALEQGADLVVQSTHKILGSLTQSSMLHVSSGILVDRERLNRCLQMVQSSSPSYLLLASLDAARAELSENSSAIFSEIAGLATVAKKKISKIPGISILSLPCFKTEVPAIDPLRITVGVQKLNTTGYKAEEFLCEEHGILGELAGRHCLTYPINPGTPMEAIERLVTGLKHLSSILVEKDGDGDGSVHHHDRHTKLRMRRNLSILRSPFLDDDGADTVRLSPRDAFFARKKKIVVADSIGEICGEMICPYPPGIAILTPGEIITESALAYLLEAKECGSLISGSSDVDLSSVVVCDLL